MYTCVCVCALTALMKLCNHLFEVSHCAEDGIDGSVVGDVITEVLHG